MVEGEVGGVAPLTENVEDVLLLLRREELGAVVVAVVGAVAAEVSLQLVAEGLVVLALYIFKQCGETVGGTYLADLLEMWAAAALQGCGQDGIADGHIVGNDAARQVADAPVCHRASVKEAVMPRGWQHVVGKVSVWIHFHVMLIACKGNMICSIFKLQGLQKFGGCEELS